MFGTDPFFSGLHENSTNFKYQCEPSFSPCVIQNKGVLHVLFKNLLFFLITELTNYIGRRGRKGITFCILHSQKAYGLPKQLVTLNLLGHIKRNDTHCIVQTLPFSNLLQACQLILNSFKFRFLFLEF